MSAWHAGDFRRMYAEITPKARARVSYTRFVAFYKRSAAVATMHGLHSVGRLHA